MSDPHVRNLGLAAGTLLAGTATLVCCVVPAVLVSIGAGAAVVSLISAFPQLVWLSEHKLVVFGTAALLLIVSGTALWRARTLPCPIDPALARSCMRLRHASQILYVIAATCFLFGAAVAFGLAP